MSGAEPEVIDNPGWAAAEPALSVLIPFLRDDPCPLLRALEEEASSAEGLVELVVLDDGSGDEALARAVAEQIGGMRLPVRFVRLQRNEGRAGGRNRLAANARARHLLFLDSDMRPATRDFLGPYLRLIRAEDPPVVFGGFCVERDPGRSEHALHRALAQRSDCACAKVRALSPEKYVFTSNLLVRRDVFEAETFDEAFSGWGWEDVEWGMRVAQRFGVRHIDNPAVHLGLDAPAALAEKYEQSIANFARVVARHPEVVARYPSYRLARLLKRAPARGLIRAALKRTALAAHAPMLARVAAIKAYRAALYAEVV